MARYEQSPPRSCDPGIIRLMAAREKTLIVALVGLSFAMGVMVGSTLLSREDAREVAAGRQANGFEKPQDEAYLDERFEMLSAQLDQIATELSSVRGTPLSALQAPAAPPERGPVSVDEPDALPDVLEQLRALEASIRSLEHAIKSQEWVTTPPTLEQLRSASPEPRWGEIEPLRGLYKQGRHDEARSFVHYLTYDEILSKFGRPTHISSNGNWYYTRTGEFGGSLYTMQLTFLDGYVTRIHFK